MAELERHDLAALLDRLEALEDPLLAWGVVHEAISNEELDGAVDAWLDQSGRGDDPDDVIDELLDAGLLLEAKEVGGYRTRIGETMRLLVDLRQLRRPKGTQELNWRGAPTLVHGIRYVRRPRYYPAYDVDPRALEADLTVDDSLEREVFRALTDSVAFRLAGFQARATEQLITRVRTRQISGVVIGAGTGAGKTLAFYLPAWTAIASSFDLSHRVRALALYPRNELLRDQLQSGVESAVRLAPLFKRRIGRVPRVGALFGQVPQAVRALRGRYYTAWTKQGDAYRCPYLSCPQPNDDGSACRGDLVVDVPEDSHDLDAHLRCVACGRDLDPDLFPVSRNQLRQRPADLLYSSTEMLNRTLLDDETGPLLGIDVPRGPELVLLDEIHTYGAASGAMTAHTIRRWRRRVSSGPVFVGLSATLMDAPRFFGELVGLYASDVEYIDPLPDELIPEAAEYQVVVRGDPTSRAGLLSTTIQSAMLTGRTMDALGAPRSHGLFGEKVFAFTDDLDVTNRLYFDLLDAEGQRHRSWGPNAPHATSLAHLRRTDVDADVDARRGLGQVWDLATAIGHGLGPDDRLAIGRTSSQDTGLDEFAQVVVATASLEVGVDDERAGAVLQHKAPRDMAAFIQRKGRAGRPRGSRPLTIVVLSDWGRDRAAYESWDRLLSPTLRPMNLPVGNVHILRMQATQSMLEWAASRAGPAVRGQGLWQTLSGVRAHPRDVAAQEAIANAMEELLTSDAARESLAAHVGQALRLERTTVEDLLWQSPRPVVLAAAPAMIRRIRDRWARTLDGVDDIESPHPREDAGARQPLPTFIPGTLFSPLAVPEVAINLPEWSQRRKHEVEPTMMGVSQALRELAPGRITKRFAIDSDLDRAWVPVRNLQDEIDVTQFVTAHQSEGTIGPDEVPLARPLEIRTEQPDRALRDSTNGRPVWRSQLRPTGPGTPLRIVHQDPLGALVTALEAHLHRDQSHVEAARGMVASDISLVFDDGSREFGRVPLVRDGAPVALGSVQDVDGLLVRTQVEVPHAVWSGRLGAQLRRDRFQHLVMTDDHLREILGPFGAELVHDVVLTGVLHRAATDGSDLRAAWEAFSSNTDESLDDALRILLASPGQSSTSFEPGTGGDQEETARRALGRPDVLGLVGELATCLWEDPRDEDLEWVRVRAVRTVGELLLGGARLLCPDQDPDSVLVDVEPEGSEPGEVWLTETTVGGGGFMEAVVDAIVAEPSRFLRLARATLRPGAATLSASALATVVERLPVDGDLQLAFATYRGAPTLADRGTALGRVGDALQALGITATPDIVASVANRLLRPGSSPATDEFVLGTLTAWRSEEERLGLEIPLRTWCHLDAARNGELDERRLDDLQLLLWPRGSAPHDAQLSSWSPYHDDPGPSATLAEFLLRPADDASIEFTTVDETWDAACDALRETGACRVRASARDQATLLDFLAQSTTRAVELEWLRLYARVTSFERDGTDTLWVELDLPEVRA